MKIIRLLYFWSASLMCRLFFRRIDVMGAPLPHDNCPVLFYGTLKNGIIDEWLLSFALDNALMFINSSESEQYPAPDEAVNRLNNGKSIFLNMSESMNNPENFVEAVVSSALQKRKDLMVVPVAIFYESVSSWGSSVDIVTGEHFNPAFFKYKENLAYSLLKELAIVDGTFSGVSPDRKIAKQLAFVVSGEDSVSYYFALRSMLRLSPDSPIVSAWNSFMEFFKRAPAHLSVYGVPIFPGGALIWEIIELLLTLPPVFAAIMMNLIPFLTVTIIYAFGAVRKKKRPLLQIISGSIALFIWVIPLWSCLWEFGMPWLIPLHVILTVTASRFIYILKLSSVKITNSLLFPRLKGVQNRLREELRKLILSDLPSEE